MASQDFLENSDTPNDKIPVRFSGSFSAPARYGLGSPRRTVHSFAHGLDYECLPDGIWSPDGVKWYPMGVVPANTSGAQPSFQTTEVDVYFGPTNVFVVCSNYNTSAADINYVVELYSRD
jgi:hypothetical protein